MNIRLLEKNEIKLLRDIDRREIIEEVYRFENGKLSIEKEYYDVNEFPCTEFEIFIKRLEEDFNKGGIVAGAFEKDKIVGMVAIQNKFRGVSDDTLLIDILYVSNRYRKYGIAKELVNFIKEKAIEKGARKLYISATPTKRTIDFYLGQGCELTKEIDKELFKKEPLDIHLELVL